MKKETGWKESDGEIQLLIGIGFKNKEKLISSKATFRKLFFP